MHHLLPYTSAAQNTEKTIVFFSFFFFFLLRLLRALPPPPPLPLFLLSSLSFSRPALFLSLLMEYLCSSMLFCFVFARCIRTVQQCDSPRGVEGRKRRGAGCVGGGGYVVPLEYSYSSIFKSGRLRFLLYTEVRNSQEERVQSLPRLPFTLHVLADKDRQDRGTGWEEGVRRFRKVGRRCGVA